MKGKRFFLAGATSLLFITGGCEEREPELSPRGSEEEPLTKTLETGAAVLQTDEPLDAINIYLVGFHPMKGDPSHQMEAHHFCRQVNRDFSQCVLFDGNTGDANLNGIEYIISEKLFESLPQDEKEYWHPHNYEILSGQLVAPNIPTVAEMELMEGKINSYGKTWHVWDTRGDVGDQLPLGDPMLAWSFNRDGEAQPGLVEERDRKMNIDTAQTRQNRKQLQELANPQEGVDSLNGQFPGSTRSIPGVAEKNE